MNKRKTPSKRTPDYVTIESVQRDDYAGLLWPDWQTGVPQPVLEVDVWRNDTAQTVSMTLPVSTSLVPQDPDEEHDHPWYLGIPPIKITLAPGAEVRLPRFVRSDVQTEQCRHPHCITKQFACKEDGHADYRTVVAGFGPMLRRVNGAPATMHAVLAAQNTPTPPMTAKVQPNENAWLMDRVRT